MADAKTEMKRSKRIAVVRVRGKTGIRSFIRETLGMLRLTRPNHCVIIDDRPQYVGMIKECKDYITWGEIDEKTFAELLTKRGRLMGNKSLGKIDSDGFSKKFMKFETELAELKAKPVFRLLPPRGGYRHVKKSYPSGAIGYRGEKINDLLKKMI